MDDKLARRLRYPRLLEDGGYAVQAGWSGQDYKIEKNEFGRFVDEFSKLYWIRVTEIAVLHLCLYSTFFFPTGFESPILYLFIASFLIFLVELLVRGKRFRKAFPEAKPVQVRSRHRFLWFGLTNSAVVLLVDGVACLLLGWGLSDVYPDAYAQDGYFYIVFGVFFFVMWAVVRGIRLYYRATRGCRLTYGNIVKTEGGASFEYTV